MDQILKYICPKCGNKECEIGEIKIEWTIRSVWKRMFEPHNRRITMVTCKNCSFTELYKVSKNKVGEVINFMGR
jgi:predicted nucleic-acid-binding Zn-ribbon protein